MYLVLIALIGADQASCERLQHEVMMAYQTAAWERSAVMNWWMQEQFHQDRMPGGLCNDACYGFCKSCACRRSWDTAHASMNLGQQDYDRGNLPYQQAVQNAEAGGKEMAKAAPDWNVVNYLYSQAKGQFEDAASNYSRAVGMFQQACTMWSQLGDCHRMGPCSAWW